MAASYKADPALCRLPPFAPSFTRCVAILGEWDDGDGCGELIRGGLGVLQVIANLWPSMALSWTTSNGTCACGWTVRLMQCRLGSPAACIGAGLKCSRRLWKRGQRRRRAARSQRRSSSNSPRTCAR